VAPGHPDAQASMVRLIGLALLRNSGLRRDNLLPLRIPGSSGQGFRFDPATHSNLIRSPLPGHPVTPSG
jgi:hypothetical protein